MTDPTTRKIEYGVPPPDVMASMTGIEFLRAIKARIVSGELGDIYVVRSNAYDDVPAPPEIIRASDGISPQHPFPS